MKDEASGRTIAEFAGLRSKLYSFRMYDGKASKKCKGVKKAVVKNALTFENYKDCLFNGTTYQAKFNVLRSRKHNVTTECVTNVALSAKDDKRYVISNDPEHRTLALDHHRALLEVYLQKIFNEIFEKVLKDVLEKELIPTEVLEEFFENFLDELLEENLAEEDFLPSELFVEILKENVEEFIEGKLHQP